MATSPLADLTYYANRSQGGVGLSDINSDRGRAALLAAQQYDPTASWREVHGSDGQSLGYTLDFDASKLPGSSGTGSLGGTSGHGSGADYQIPFSTVQPGFQLKDPNAVTNSPTYGRITDNTNIKQPSSLLDTLGPAAVGGFGLALGGIPALYGGIFGQGAYGSGAAGAGALDTAGDSYLGLTNDGFPAFQGVPGADAATGGLTPAQWNDIIAGQPENGFTPPDFATPGPLTQFANATGLSRFAAKIPQAISALGKVPGLMGSGAAGGAGGGGSGGGGLLGRPATDDALAVLKAFYGDPNLTGAKYLARQRTGLLNG